MIHNFRDITISSPVNWKLVERGTEIQEFSSIECEESPDKQVIKQRILNSLKKESENKKNRQIY